MKTIDVSSLPVRAGRFIARKNWVVVGSDDLHIRVYNYNTSEKVAQFEAHPDYIRTIAVHPTEPLVLSGGDDMTVKLWNWEQGWRNTHSFEGHSHYIMYVAFNPKDPNTFASASLDHTVKIWSLGSPTPNFTLDAHETRGVNFVQYYPQSDKPYLITASDDRTVRVWDYQTKSCVATLEGHTNNVSFAVFHPELPVIISGAEDSTIKIWNANTYHLEQTLNYGLERAWCAACRKGSNSIALGFDVGSVVLQLGKEEPAISMDPNGRVIWSKHSEVFSHAIKGSEEYKDGDIIPVTPKELGNVEVYPTKLVHSPNGRFVTVVGDGEYIIFTALAWRNKSFGTAVDFAWSQDSSQYAVLEAKSDTIQVFKNFKQMPSGFIDLNFAGSVSQVYGGALLGLKGDGFLAFYDWESGKYVYHVGTDPQQVIWSESGELVTVISDDAFYVLKFNREDFQAALQEGSLTEEGVDSAFELLQEVPESVRTGRWVGDCFVYTTHSNRLCYLVGSETYTVAHFDKQMYLLGYLPRDNSIYLCDKDINMTSYKLSLAVIEYQTVVLRGDMDYAAELLQDVPEKERTKVARFLEKQGHQELALEVTQDPEHKFDLALALNQLSVAEEIAHTVNNEHKWKQLGDAALEGWNVVLAERSFEEANDLDSLVLIYTSTGNKGALRTLAQKASDIGKYNLAFNALWFIGDTDGCIELLNKTGRPSEAALFALTYGGDVNGAVKLWKDNLTKAGRGKIANSIADPAENPELFPDNIGEKVVTKPATANGAVADLIDVDDDVAEVEAEAGAAAEEAETPVEQAPEPEKESQEGQEQGDDEEDAGDVQA